MGRRGRKRESGVRGLIEACNGQWRVGGGRRVGKKDLRERSWRLRCSLLLKALLQNWHLYFRSGTSEVFREAGVDAAEDAGATATLAPGILTDCMWCVVLCCRTHVVFYCSSVVVGRESQATGYTQGIRYRWRCLCGCVRRRRRRPDSCAAALNNDGSRKVLTLGKCPSPSSSSERWLNIACLLARTRSRGV